MEKKLAMTVVEKTLKRPTKTSELNIYKKTYDFYKFLIQTCHNCRKEYKDTICDKILDAVSNMLTHIVHINKWGMPYGRKLIEMDNFIDLLDTVSINIRVLTDLKAISIGQSAESSLFIGNISKQIVGWRKSVIKELKEKGIDVSEFTFDDTEDD